MPLYQTTKHPRFWRIAPYVLIVAAFSFGLHSNAHTANQARDSLVRTGTIVAVDGCNRDFRSITNLRATFDRLIMSNNRSFAAGRITPEQHREAVAFYTEQKNKNPLPDCRDAKHVISADANPNAPIPTPRYPGDGKDSVVPPASSTGG